MNGERRGEERKGSWVGATAIGKRNQNGGKQCDEGETGTAKDDCKTLVYHPVNQMLTGPGQTN